MDGSGASGHAILASSASHFFLGRATLPTALLERPGGYPRPERLRRQGDDVLTGQTSTTSIVNHR